MHTRLGAIALALLIPSLAFAADDKKGADAKGDPKDAAPFYTVIEENAEIVFPDTAIRGYRVGKDRSLIIEASRNRWYRAELNGPCRSDLPFTFQVAFVSRPLATFDRFSSVIVDGHRCPVWKLDRIDDPRIAEKAAIQTEAPAAAEPKKSDK